VGGGLAMSAPVPPLRGTNVGGPSVELRLQAMPTKLSQIKTKNVLRVDRFIMVRKF